MYNRDSIQILPNIRHLASIDLKTLWQNRGSDIYTTILIPQNILGDKRFCFHLCPKVRVYGSPIAEYLPSFGLWIPNSTWRQGGYHGIHEARIHVCGSPCSRSLSKTSSNLPQDEVCKYVESLI